MQFPNPIVRALIIYDTSGNAVVIIGPGPILKVVSPMGQEIDIDPLGQGTNTPTIEFWNTAHTAFSFINAPGTGFGVNGFTRTSTVSPNPVIRPRLFFTDIGITLGYDIEATQLNYGAILGLSEDTFFGNVISNTGAVTGAILIQNNSVFIQGGNGTGLTGPQVIATGSSIFMADSALVQNIIFEPAKCQWTYNTSTLGGWTTYTYANGWHDLGSNWSTGQFKIDANGRVILKGVILGGTLTDGTVIFTLPLTARPVKDVIVPIAMISTGSGSNYHLRIFAATGQAQIFGASATATGNISLDGSSLPITA
jgi:hypothetical protein